MPRRENEHEDATTPRRPAQTALTEDIGPVSATIKRVMKEKGFGFAILADGKEVFFHMTAVGDEAVFADLRAGQAVTIVYASTQKGLRASRLDLAV